MTVGPPRASASRFAPAAPFRHHRYSLQYETLLYMLRHPSRLAHSLRQQQQAQPQQLPQQRQQSQVHRQQVAAAVHQLQQRQQEQRQQVATTQLQQQQQPQQQQQQQPQATDAQQPQPQAGPQADAAPQPRSLTLTRDQLLEAQALFRTADKVTRPEKALILGFMAGSRENPCPHLGNVVTIKLSERQEDVLQQESHSVAPMTVETHFQMNYSNGERKIVKRYRRLEDPSPVGQLSAGLTS